MRSFALCAALLLALPAAVSALGTEFTYQGELREAGVPASGSYDLEFRLYDAASGGTQLGSTRSLNAQSIAAGVFTAVLDFGDQFTGAPRWIEVAVRRSGQPTFVPLLPRQVLSAAPYALHAEFVADNSIVGASIVDGSLSGSDLLAGSVATSQIANGGVASVDLADAAATTAKIADNAVTSAKILDATIATADLANASVTAAKLANGAVGAAQINLTEVQARLAGSCPAGFALLGYDDAGAPSCDDPVVYLGAGLTRPQLQLGPRDEPRVLGIDPALQDLVFISCGDDVCSDGPLQTTLDAGIGNSGSAAFVVRSTGAPFVAYYDEAVGDLHSFDCNAADCTNSNFRSLDSSGLAGIGVDVALRSGNLPVVGYLVGGANPELRLYDCDDADCVAGTVRTLDTTNVDIGSRVAIVVAPAGQPVIFYRGSGASVGLNAYVCGNADCTSGTSHDLNDDDGISGLDAVTRGAQVPMAAYVDVNGAVQTYDCSGLICSFGVQRELSATTNTGRVGIAFGTDDDPLIAFHASSALRIYDCGNNFCSTGVANTFPTDADYNGSPSIAIRGDGRVVLVGEDEALDGSLRLRLDLCGNEGCRQ